MQRAGAVVLRDEIDDPLRQSHLLGKLLAVSYMADDDLGALHRFQAVVRIAARLILHKMFGRGRFAYIVIKRADASKQVVRADGSAGFLRKLADGVRMLVCSRRPERELAENGQVRVRQFKQLYIGQNSEQRFAYRQKYRGCGSGYHS